MELLKRRRTMHTYINLETCLLDVSHLVPREDRLPQRL